MKPGNWFCTLKLLRQKKGVTQCPLCNAKVTKRSLREDVRFKQVIKAVLETIHAFECDTGLKFSDDQCFPREDTEATSTAVLWKEQQVVDCKGYRDRLKRVKEGKKGNTNLGESSNLPVGNGTNKRYSLRRNSSNKAVVLEVGSDSSEDAYKKTATVKCVDIRRKTLSHVGEKCAENQSPCQMDLPGSSAEDEALNILDACSFSEERMRGIECTPAGIDNVEIPSKNVVVQKNQPLSFPDPSMEQHDTKSEASSLQQDGSGCSFNIAQVVGEATSPTADKQAGDGRERAGVLLPDGSAHALCENEENLLQSQTSANSPLNQVTGKRLIRSIRKVSEWLSRSKEVLSPISLWDIHSEEVHQDLNPCMLDADFRVSEKTRQIEDEGEFTMCHGSDGLLPKLLGSKIEDKIFGRTYRRERKSTPLQNERDIIHIQAEECIVVNTKSCETPRKKALTRKRKATSELTPDDFIRRQDVKECRKNPVGDDGVPLEERDPTFAPVKDRPIAHQKDTELPEEFSIKEALSSLEATGSGQAVNICHKLPESNLKNPKRRPNSLCKRSRQLTRPLGPLQFVVDGRSMFPEQSKIQIEDEAKEADTSQRQIRRSRRLQLLTEDSWSGNKEFQLQPEGAWKQSEPATREKKKEVDREKKQGHSQAENMPPHSVTENDPSTSQKGLPWSDASPMDIEDDGSKLCGNPLTSPCVIRVVKGLSVEETKEECSPCFIAATAGSQGSCSLLRFPPTEVKQIISDEDKRFIAGQSEKNALYGQTQSNGSCTGVVTEGHSPPDDKAAGTVELNPETDDNELEADFVQKIFSGCKRQSFLLHPGPVKEPANEIQGELKVGRVEDGRVDYLEKLTQNEERREAVACGADKDITAQRLATSVSSFPELENKTENLQLALQAPLPDHLSMQVQSVAKIGEGGNQLQSQKPATERRVSPEMRENTSPSGSSRSLSGNTRSPSVLRNGNFQSSSLSLVNETRSSTDYFQEPESAGVEKKGLTLSPQPESRELCTVNCHAPLPQFSHVGKRSSMDQKQLNSDIEEATDISSVGVPRCLVPGENLDQCTEEEFHAFPLSLETPEGLLDPALTSKEGPPNLLESDREDISVVSSKIDEQPLVGKDLDSSDRSSSMFKRKRFVSAHRRPVRKLPSSEEDDSSEEEKLPCFQALLFDTLSHPLNKNERSAEVQALMSSRSSNLRPKDEDVSPSQESECSVNLFSSQSHASGDSCSKACDIRQLTPVCSSIEKLASLSENKKDIKPSSDVSSEVVQTKEEQPRRVDSKSNLGEECTGYDSEASHLGDSSGLSSQSEILTTQQRNTMQNDLKKLQQEMVIIEAALKQGSQHDAPEEWLQLDKEDDFTGEQMRSLKGSTEKLTSESKRILPGDSSSIVKSTHGTLSSHSTPFSKPEEQISCCLTTATRKRSPNTIPGTFRRPLTPRHEAQKKLTSPLTLTALCCSKKENSKSPLLSSKRNMSLVASGLNQGELRLVQRFARKTESTWSNKITEETTHVVMKTDEDLVCERTLKYFLGIAAQKWVVSYQWIEQSLKAGRVLNEEDFEVRGDVINGRNHQGPKRARESPAGKLFQGLEICCYGPFSDMLPEQLEWMVKLCGASLVKQPHLFAHATNSSAIVVVQPDAWVEDAACQGLPPQCSATVVLREWVLDSVACYQRQPFDEYIVQPV